MTSLVQKEQGMEILGPYLPLIEQLMFETLSDVNKAMGAISTSMNKRTRSTLFHNISTEKIKHHFKGDPNVIIKEKYESIQIVFNKKIVGRVKKINKDNFPSNADSKRNSMIIGQQLSLLPETELTYIDLGYKIDADQTWTDFDNLLVVCRVNNSIEWYMSFKTEESIITTEPAQIEIVHKEQEKQLKIKKAQ